jgi:hypothetical protein
MGNPIVGVHGMRCMSEGRSLYRIHDKDSIPGCHSVTSFAEADEFNAQGWGIFWTVNQFVGARKIPNCVKVLSWAVDLDAGSKQEQLDRINDCLTVPSYVVETARGHHVYFDSIDGDVDNYRDIVERLVEFYDGDERAKDAARILRVPGQVHCKGTPFGIKVVWPDPMKPTPSMIHAYTEREMRKAFKRPDAVEQEFDQKTDLRRNIKIAGGGNLWEKIWSLDCEQALKQISGRDCVKGEMFSFRRTSNGNLNILVNGKGTSCWIDARKRIGSHDKGGPTIANWIHWYQRDWKRTVEFIKSAFPEVLQ